jgi:hypothetical protein
MWSSDSSNTSQKDKAKNLSNHKKTEFVLQYSSVFLYVELFLTTKLPNLLFFTLSFPLKSFDFTFFCV